MHAIIFQGFIANECSALRPELENNHGPSQLKGSRGPGFWLPAKYQLAGTSHVQYYQKLYEKIYMPVLPTIHSHNFGSGFFP